MNPIAGRSCIWSSNLRSNLSRNASSSVNRRRFLIHTHKASLNNTLIPKRTFSSSPLTAASSSSSSSSSLASSSSSPASSTSEQLKPKPKSATQLRRTAAASLPIRSNPTPTRSDIRPVTVITTAERYLLPQLRARLPASAIPIQSAWWIPRWAGRGKGVLSDANNGKSGLEGKEGKGGIEGNGKLENEGEIFIFGNGTVVCWGLEEGDARKFVRDFIGGSNAEVGRLAEYETEDVEFVTDPNETTRLQGDLIILGTSPPPEDPTSLHTLPTNQQMVLPPTTLLARYSYSQALARSSALSALEEKLDVFLSSVSALPVTLSHTGQGLNLNHENFLDMPDFYWAEPKLEAYFQTMADALDIKSRTHSLNEKITYAAEVQSVLRELLTESSAHRMELIIILLISVEVVICLIRDGPELWDLLFDKKDKQEGVVVVKEN
ncbi:hypothetical protein PNOK_0765700 [Pyrrhoderma noxium]|uniref:DUF155 domain-containing protein n=1 Tax=Pyrrhoderma noxium TaxID=2282107 RepID=A0A286U8X6_9AGAM|nr:hypothetical protein PNOK_0765700 [Pyrrhoderma noxium]